MTQDFWYVDPINGDDALDATTDTYVGNGHGPLKTAAALQAKMGGIAYPLTHRTQIKILNDLPNLDSLHLALTMGGEASSNDNSTLLVISGKRTQLVTGSITSYTPFNRLTPEHNLIYTSGFDWAPYVDQYIRFTSGLGAGYGAWVAKNLGSGVARISTLVQEQDPFPARTVVAPNVQPSGIIPGDTFEILRFASIGYTTLSFRSHGGCGFATTDGASTWVQLKDVRVAKQVNTADAISSAYIETLSHGIRVTAHRVDLGSLVQGPGIMTALSCRRTGGMGTVRSGGSTGYLGGLITGILQISASSTATLDQDILFQGAKLTLGAGSSGRTLSCFPSGCRIGTAAFLDVSGDAIEVNGASTLEMRTTAGTPSAGTHAAWGSCTGAGVRIRAGGKMNYEANKPTINTGLGAGREAIVGGTNKLWSEIPYVNLNNLSMIVQDA